MSSRSDTSLPQSVELLRTKLQQVTTSLVSLQNRVVSGDPLPSWSSLLSSLNVTLTQLSGLLEVLQRHEKQLLKVLLVPNLTFPASQEGLLTTLLRTKLLPETETWQSSIAPGATDYRRPITFIDQDEEETSAAVYFSQERLKRQWTGYYTRAEIAEDYEIDKEDLDDLRISRRRKVELARDEMKAMLKFARTGR